MARGEHTPSAVILGIGNLLWADEGFGVRCLEQLQQGYVWPADVALVDGGTQGLNLIEHVQAAPRLLIFDAVDYGLTPGEVKVVRDADVPSFLGVKKLSLHQTGFQEVLALAQLLGRYPEQLVLIGCQPQTLDDFGGSLTAVVQAALPRALERGLDELRTWGIDPVPQPPLGAAACQHQGALSLGRYEGERPCAGAAPRHGDPRFMPREVE
jgi:hydrogenase maturation protease